MTQLSENIFDARGMLRSDLENVTVPPERRSVFDALVSAVKAAEVAEADVIVLFVTNKAFRIDYVEAKAS